MCNFLCQKVLSYSQKYLKHFGLEMSRVYGVLAHFEFKIHKDFKTIPSLYVLNCFKYFLIHILGQNVSKN